MTIRSTPQRLTTGVAKFLCHPRQMTEYRHSTSHSVITSFISPTGACNLNCDYCCCAGHRRQVTIPYAVIQDYVLQLRSRGLESVILTGGGEPTLYPYFNRLVAWLRRQGLSIGLMTNGTQAHLVTDWDAFKWVRVSINTSFEGWADTISVGDAPLVGASLIYTGQSHETFRRVVGLLDKVRADYLRVSVDYLLPNAEFARQYAEAEERLADIDDPRISLLRNSRRAPHSTVCHLSYFRPFLSEVDGGTVYGCCIPVIEDGMRKLRSQDAVCKAESILDFLDGRIMRSVMPEQDCAHCLFADTVEALQSWVVGPRGPHEYTV